MREVWEKWKRVAARIGDFQASVLFSILYFLLVTPMGLAASLFADFLKTKKFPRWEEYGAHAKTKKALKEQF